MSFIFMLYFFLFNIYYFIFLHICSLVIFDNGKLHMYSTELKKFMLIKQIFAQKFATPSTDLKDY